MKTQLVTLNSAKRRKLLKNIFLVILACVLCGKITLSDTPNNQQNQETHQHRPAVGTRGIGLSRAYVSSTDDATSPLWNPAGLASLENANLIYDFSQGAFSVAYPIKHIGTFGINILDLNASDRFLVHNASNPIGTFEYGSNQALFSYARNFGRLQLGASTGYSRAPYVNSLWAPNYDIGALMALPHNVVIGMHFRDITGVSIHDDTNILLQTYDPQFVVGSTFTPHPSIRWHSCLNVAPLSFGTSIEFVTGPFSANIGSFFSSDPSTPTQTWSLGLSLNKWGKQTYYTFLNEDNNQYKHLISFGITFGGAQKSVEESKYHKVKSESNSTTSKVTQKTSDTPNGTKSDIRDNTLHITPPTIKNSTQIANKHNVSIELMLAIIYVESKFNPVAVSPTGAGGLMQMVPTTARELGLKVPKYSNKLKPSLDGNVDERFDAAKNLEIGLIYFNQLLIKYQNNLTLALGAYNVGPGRVRIGGPLISRGKAYANSVIDRRDLYRQNANLLANDLKRLEIILNK